MQDKHPDKKGNVTFEEKDTQEHEASKRCAKANDANAIGKVIG
jgi:hypothetical protein